MTQLIILVTGSRRVADEDEARSKAGLLLRSELTMRAPKGIGVVHGFADGWDKIFHYEAKELGIISVPYGMDDPRFNPRCYSNPLERNQFMVDIVSHWVGRYAMAAVCWSFARQWASGTGHCARRARQAGITVVDYGVKTDGPRPKND